MVVMMAGQMVDQKAGHWAVQTAGQMEHYSTAALLAAHWAAYLAGQRAALKARCLLVVQTAVPMARH